jgi:diguanylate cyclase
MVPQGHEEAVIEPTIPQRMKGEAHRILIVDGDRAALELMEAALCSAGFCVSTSTDGREGLALAGQEQFDLVMLDIGMPDGSGLDVCRALRREAGDLLPIVMITGIDDVQSVDAAYQAGATDFIARPISWALLAHRVRYMLRAHQNKLDLAAARENIHRLAYFDSLTGAPNREYFQSILAGAIDSHRRSAGQFALLCIDLDNFKRINDTLGHGVGDELLRVVTARLREELRSQRRPPTTEPGALEHDGMCRVGGDEFMVLLQDLAHADDALAVAERLIAVVSQPMRLSRHKVLVTPSIGIALCPGDGQDAEMLVRSADLAMYFAKRRAPGSAALFQADMSADALLRLTLEGELRLAIERNQLFLEYQPQYSLASGRISGMEALLRWNHSSLGMVPPAEFVPIAEQTGLILPIGDWVLQTACAQARAWQLENQVPVRIAVNVSGLQLIQPDFTAKVAQTLAQTQLPARLLELEITETVVVQDDARAVRTLQDLQAMGVEIAIDDFGTGQSSFARLSRFPVNRLKIDRAFVKRAHMSGADNAIASAMIAMAKTLNIEVVAEGIEEMDQLMVLQEHRCDFGQGYLLSRPLRAGDALELLRRDAREDDGTARQRLRHQLG